MNAKLNAELSREHREDHLDALGQKPQRQFKTYDCDDCHRYVPVEFIREVSGGSFCVACCTSMTVDEMLAEIAEATA